MSEDENPYSTILAELVIHRQLSGQSHDLTLRLTPQTLTLTPGEETGQFYNKYLVQDQQQLANDSSFMNRLFSKALEKVASGVTSALAPHPLRETDMRLDSMGLYVRLGGGDAVYAPNEFDHDQAADFIERYRAAKAAAL